MNKRNSSKISSSIHPSISQSLTKDGYDWLVSAVDPFHDFERPIEGAPDIESSRSFTRRFNQSVTVGATADDDYITIDFFGSHGVKANFFPWGADASPDTVTSTGVEVYPVTVLRTIAAVGEPTVGELYATTATLLAGFNTTQSPTIMSRIISMGIEVTDITPSLYKKGTIYCTHVNGAAQTKAIRQIHTADVGQPAVYFHPPLPTNTSQMVAIPGTYVGRCADGLYTQGRIGNIVRPTQCEIYNNNGALSGCFSDHPVLSYADPTAPRSEMYQPCSNTGDAVNLEYFYHRYNWSDSGFQPFRIVCSGLSEYTTLQISLRLTVEYFPTPTHLFECGLATFSPSYDPLAFVAYHAIVSQLPFGVPVGMNAKGEFWNMVRAAAARVADFLRKHGGTMLHLGGNIASAMGQPEIGMIAKAVAARLPPPMPPRSKPTNVARRSK